MFLLILLLVVFGAKRLPEIGRSLGTGLRGFKETLTGEGTSSSLTTGESEQPVQTAAATHPSSVAAPVAATGNDASVPRA
jgi:sec-independent protein translocase protein TatA